MKSSRCFVRIRLSKLSPRSGGSGGSPRSQASARMLVTHRGHGHTVNKMKQNGNNHI